MRWTISGIQRGMLQELREILPTSLTTPTLPGSAQSELWEPRDTLLINAIWLALRGPGGWGQAYTVASASSPHPWLVVLGAGHRRVPRWPLRGHPPSRLRPPDYIYPKSSSFDLGRCWSPETG